MSQEDSANDWCMTITFIKSPTSINDNKLKILNKLTITFTLTSDEKI